MKAATRSVNFYTTPEVLIGYRRFWLPSLVALLFVIISAVWARSRAVRLRTRMHDVKLDLKESWLSNVGAATIVLNVVLGIGSVGNDLRPEITTLTGLFGLLIVTGPLVYNLTLSTQDNQATGPVWAFILACGLTLTGACGALETAYILFDHFAQASVISRPMFALYACLVFALAVVIVMYAVRTAHRTILSQVVDARASSNMTAPERGALL